MNIKYLRLCSCGGGGVRCTPGGAQSCLGGGGRVARGGSCAQAAERETPTRYTNAISPDFLSGDCLVIVASDGGEAWSSHFVILVNWRRSGQPSCW